MAELFALPALLIHSADDLTQSDSQNEVTHGVKKSTTFNQTEQEGREKEVLNSPLFQVTGLFAIGEPGWADRHDEYLAQGYLESHANDK